MRRGPATYGYARVSSRDQDEHGTSLEGQTDRFVRRAELAGLPRPDIRVEVESASRRAIERRAELAQLISDAQPGDTILVCKVDRWSRDVPFAVQSVRDLVARGVRWISIDEGIDASTPQGDSTLGIMAWVADQEHKRIRERTVLRRAELVAQGYWAHGATPTFGYRRGDGDKFSRLILAPVEADAALALDMFKRCVRGASVVDLSEWLADERPGRGWSPSLVKSLLTTRVYLGEIKTPTGWVKAKHAAIIPRELWAQAQEAKRTRAKGRKPSGVGRTASWLLRPSFARCGHCGSPMRSAYGRLPEYEYMVCRDQCGAPFSRVRDVDPVVATLAAGRLAELRGLLAAAPLPVARPKARDYAAERARWEGALSRAQGLAVDGLLDASALRQQTERVRATLERLDREEAAVARETAAASPSARAVALADVRKLERAWRQAPVPARRAIVERLAHTVTLRSGEPPVPTWRTEAELVADNAL